MLNNELKEKKSENKFLGQFEKIDFFFDTPASSEMRSRARNILSDLKLPTTKDEYWKYTRVSPLLKKEYVIAPEQKASIVTDLRYENTIELVFVNGYYKQELSKNTTIDGLKVCTLSEAKKNDFFGHEERFGSLTELRKEVFATINSAFHNEGAFISAGKNFNSDQVVHLIHISSGADVLSQPRNIFVLEEGAQLEVIETYASEEATSGALVNSVSEVFLDANANLKHYKLQELGEENHQISTEEASLLQDSSYEINTYTLSGKLVRNNLNTSLQEQNATCSYNGLYLTKDKQLVDNHTIIDHIAPHCESHELYKGILNDRSTAVFNGRVLVRRPAQKTNAFQSNANLLLTDDATINSKPELEIYADDVKCSHGSTTGQLDEDALFYLEARGIDKEKARNLLLYAFAAEVLDHVTYEPLKERITKYIGNRYNNEF